MQKMTKKDIAFIIVFFTLITINILCHFSLYGVQSVNTVIEQTIISMLAILGLVQIAEFCNWTFVVPDFFISAQEKNVENKTKDAIAAYFINDINYIHNYNEERMNYFMSQLGITTRQLDDIRLELIRMRCMPLSNLTDAEEKIQKYVKNEYPFVIDQRKIDSSRLSYKKVKYYLNFTDPMFLPDYSREIASWLVFLVQQKTDNLQEIDKLIIPYDSNFLLGVEVGRRLGKPVVRMRYSKGKIVNEQPWEGNLSQKDRVIIIHDVLVEAKQIVHALNYLPRTCEVLGVYCLITRKEWDGAKVLEDRRIRVEQILCLDDHDIAKIRGENES